MPEDHRDGQEQGSSAEGQQGNQGGQGSTGGNQQGKPPWGDDFDADRAWQTITHLRGIEEQFKALKKQSDEDAAARKKAEDDALAEQQKFKELAEKRQTEIDALKPRAEAADKYEAALKKYLDAEREGLPAHIITLLDLMDVAEQLDYITENRETLKPAGSNGASVPPTATGNSDGQAQVAKARDYIASRYGRKGASAA